MLVWVVPWVIIRTIHSLIYLITSGGLETYSSELDPLALELAQVVVIGACWSGVLYGFIRTAADPEPWNWSQTQTQQPQMAPSQPSNYAPPVGIPQVQGGRWGQEYPSQRPIYQPDTSHPPTSSRVAPIEV